MPVSSLPEHQHLHRDMQQLLRYSDALTRSGSKLEDDFWESKLVSLIDKVLTAKEPKLLETLFEYLGQQQLHSHYEILAGLAEGMAESWQFEHKNIHYDGLLISLPITTWTRYQLPHGELAPTVLADLEQCLLSHVLNPTAKISAIAHLLSFDQLPVGFNETRHWLTRLAKRAVGAGSSEITVRDDEETVGLLADARFILFAVVVPKGEAIFRWQLELLDPLQAQLEVIDTWQAQCQRILGDTFRGCSTDYWLPNAFYANNREADKHMRPLTIKAAVTWLQTAAQVPVNELIVVIAPCGDEQLEEYRIGFNLNNNSSAIYGAIWPIFSPEETDSNSPEYLDTPNEIASLLKEFGITEVRLLPGLYLPEICDDCNAPFFPNEHGELRHPDLPEEINLDPLQLH